MACANPNALGVGSTSTVEKVLLNGSFAARKTFNTPTYYTQERQILETLNSSPNQRLVRLLAHGKRHLDLEYVSGGSIWDVLSNSTRFKDFTQKDVSRMVVQCLVGLEHFHRVTRKAHFDIKPSNVLLTEGKDIKICDFGHACNPSNVRHLQGTYEYMPPELHCGDETDFTVDVYSLGITFYEFVCRRHPFMEYSEMREQDDVRMQKLRERGVKDVTVDHPKIPLSSALKQAISAMCEPRLKLRPNPLRALEYLRVEQMEAEHNQLKEENSQLKEENTHLKAEIGQLQESLKRKHDEAKPKTATPASRLADMPEWMQPGWAIRPDDTTQLHALAARLNQSNVAPIFMEFALYLRRLFLNLEASPPPHMAAVLAEIDKQCGYAGDGGGIDLLLLCCLAITHTRDGAVNLITNFKRDGKPLRCGTRLRHHFSRLQDAHFIPPQFQPLAQAAESKKSKHVEVEPGEIVETPAVTLPHQPAPARRTPQQIVCAFAEALKLGEHAHAAYTCARYLQKVASGTAASLEGEPLAFIQSTIESEGQSGIGPHIKLLLIASVSLSPNPTAAFQLISSFLYEGLPLRNSASLRTAFYRMKSETHFPPEFQ